MQKLVLTDNCKKEKKYCIVLLIFLIMIVVVLFLKDYLFKGEDDIISYIIAWVLVIILFLLWLNRFLFCCFYKLKVTEEEVWVKTIFGVNTIQFIDKYSYKYRKYNPITNLYAFKVFVDNKKIIVYTHYCEEFKEILDAIKN